MSNVIELNKELDTDKLDEIISRVDNEITCELDSLQSSHKLNSILEYVERGTFCYDDIEEKHQQTVQNIVENLDLSDLNDFYAMEYHQGIGRNCNEIWSINVGEIEVYLYEIVPNNLTKDEIDYIRSKSDYYFPNGMSYGYADCSYDRYSYVLDVDALLKHYNTEYVAKVESVDYSHGLIRACCDHVDIDGCIDVRWSGYFDIDVGGLITVKRSTKCDSEFFTSTVKMATITGMATIY